MFKHKKIDRKRIYKKFEPEGVSRTLMSKIIINEFMNTQKSGCFVCGKKLIYKNENIICFYCGKSFFANAKCVDGHYVCDSCHTSSANDFIENFCITSNSKNPIDLAISIMKHHAVKMHGPEHHFLVPAVLLSAYYNEICKFQEKESKIKEARRRAEQILGGFCGSHGNCGAAVGTGIFLSIIKDNTPLAKNEWKESNLITAKSLTIIAKHGGPRCCKRNTFLAINSAIECFDGIFEKNKKINCEFHTLNRECKKAGCLFF